MTFLLLGRRNDGSPVFIVELKNANGMMLRVLTLGATIQSLHVPDRCGALADVVLGHSTIAEYESKRQYFGATVGRYANRIAKGTFLLAGKRYSLDINDGKNHLHGGVHGFDFANWDIESIDLNAATITLSHESQDGEGGYPGKVRVIATFTLNNANELIIDYRAETDQPGPLNITHHGYFNLAGESSGRNVLDHQLQVNATSFTPINAILIPRGDLQQVVRTPFDFTTAKRIGDALRSSDEQLSFGHGFDHNFAIAGKANVLRSAAVVSEPISGRCMKLLTTAPGLQFYTGNFLDGTTRGKTGLPYEKHAGLCLEPQYFPDSPNQPLFPSALLRPGEVFHNRIVLKFSIF